MSCWGHTCWEASTTRTGLRFEEHLKQCGTCRGELSDLETLPGLLDAVPVARRRGARRPRSPAGIRAPADRWPPSPKPVLDELAARRRNSRRRLTALVGVVAAACLALGFAAAPLFDPADKPDASYSVRPAPACRSRWEWSRKHGAPNWPWTGGAYPRTAGFHCG